MELTELYEIKDEILIALAEMRISGNPSLVMMAEEDLRDIESQITDIFSY